MNASITVAEATSARNDRAAEYAEATYALEVAKAGLKRAQQEHDDAVLLLTLADSQMHGAIAAAAPETSILQQILWELALQAAHDDGAHGADETGYWATEVGCKGCRWALANTVQ